MFARSVQNPVNFPRCGARAPLIPFIVRPKPLWSIDRRKAERELHSPVAATSQPEWQANKPLSECQVKLSGSKRLLGASPLSANERRPFYYVLRTRQRNQ